MEIKFKNVTLFKNHYCCGERKVLDSVNFNLKEKNIYAFLGNSGSGKTSICELINFLEVPTKGFIKVGNYVNNGIKRNLNKLRFNVGYVYKRPSDMFVCSTVKKELEFGLKYFKYKIKTKNTRILNSLKMVGLDEEYLNMDPFRLNLNEQKKVALASVLTFNPKVLIIDEPTIGLNDKEKKELIRLLKTLKNKYKKIIILMTKDTDFIYSFVDYIYVLKDGIIIKEGKKKILMDDKLLEKHDFKVPNLVTFTKKVRDSKHKINDYDDLSDLIKGVYRSAR